MVIKDPHTGEINQIRFHHDPPQEGEGGTPPPTNIVRIYNDEHHHAFATIHAHETRRLANSLLNWGGYNIYPSGDCFMQWKTINVSAHYEYSWCERFGKEAEAAEARIAMTVAEAAMIWFSQPGICAKLQIVEFDGPDCTNRDTDPTRDFSDKMDCDRYSSHNGFFENWVTLAKTKERSSSVSRDETNLFRWEASKDSAIGCAEPDTICLGDSSFTAQIFGSLKP